MQILEQKVNYIKKVIYQLYPGLKQLNLEDFIDYLFTYVEEQDLQRFDNEKCDELAEVIAGSILEFFGGYSRITKWW